jgi:hypothetical protein
MTTSAPPAPPPNPQAAKQIAAREARLATALRANLRRRKHAPKTDDQTD